MILVKGLGLWRAGSIRNTKKTERMGEEGETEETKGK